MIAWAIIVCAFLALAVGAGLGLIAARIVAFIVVAGVLIWASKTFGEMALIGGLALIAIAAAGYAVFGDYYSERMVEDRRANPQLRAYYRDRRRREKNGRRD
jgi:uncharacterized membrane protein YebE (DUF533 family)